jgi:TonB family protein
MIMSKARYVMIVVRVLVAGLACISLAQEQKDETTVEVLEGMRYPPLARTAHVEGRVVVQVKLNDSGGVVSASAMPSEKVVAMLIPDAVSNARKWRFHPNPNKVAEIVYEFQLLNECIQPQSEWHFVFKAPNVV